MAEHIRDARCDLVVEPGRARIRDVAVGIDHELRVDLAVEARMREQPALVAVRDLLDVAPDVTADEALV